MRFEGHAAKLLETPFVCKRAVGRGQRHRLQAASVFTEAEVEGNAPLAMKTGAVRCVASDFCRTPHETRGPALMAFRPPPRLLVAVSRHWADGGGPQRPRPRQPPLSAPGAVGGQHVLDALSGSGRTAPC